ncbi:MULTISPECIES: ZIP family metal transporter [Halorubrum]|uniref:Zinc permease n=1 Tax=Halorubrum tropicale TaxID=1765655 RepID=A0A0M9APE8_9EURY|nr:MULTISPECIES: ZIP family metal transporter [Halorubrum]KOX96177.1 zinc permease [Halorubrum tropicale]TKX45798.1 ZIP family metal transporter [Halorubrum sp. ARQ200]TKX63893.1 ZIP family metal transporter [Halorubrum sp. ASP1]
MAVEITEAFVRIAGTSSVAQAFVGGVIIALLNLAGASLVLVWRSPSERALNGMLGFAAGVMLAAAFTSLIIPGVEEYSGGNPIPTLIGVGVGALFLDRADALIPHAHFLLTGSRRMDAANPGETLPVSDDRVTGVVLFVLAITLHNMPEGLAVGVGFGAAAGDPAQLGSALSLMLAIGIQNIPEGLAVSVAAINAGLDRRIYAAFAGIRAGVVEIPLAVLGAVAVAAVAPLLPYAMGFAAGAMLFVISDEIIPETHRSGHERVATLGLMVGVITMLYLDISLAA